jgi:hypothetical protein
VARGTCLWTVRAVWGSVTTVGVERPAAGLGLSVPVVRPVKASTKNPVSVFVDLCPVFGCVGLSLQGGRLTISGGVGLAVSIAGACPTVDPRHRVALRSQTRSLGRLGLSEELVESAPRRAALLRPDQAFHDGQEAAMCTDGITRFDHT